MLVAMGTVAGHNQAAKHEIEHLTETAQSEREFLVDKLQRLYTAEDLKHAMKELNTVRAMHGRDGIATTPEEYNLIHLTTKNLSPKEEQKYHKKERTMRKKERRKKAINAAKPRWTTLPQ
eukprot:SAG11_NODE_4811_length_1758_cov_1.572634_3_plen_120_part_00